MSIARADGLAEQEMVDTLRVPQHLCGEDAHEAFGSVN